MSQVLDQALGEGHVPRSITAPNSNHAPWRIGPIGEACSLHCIRSGKPVENAFIESFNGRLRDEGLNGHPFASLADAQALLEAWRIDDNQPCPHRSLGHLPPSEFATQRQAEQTVEEVLCSG